MKRTRHHERTVPDVSTEVDCPARLAEFAPHVVECLGQVGRPGRPTRDPVWGCIYCRVPWADLDAAVRPKPRGTS